ncbi:helix-turn-helix domain-containing protein [Methylobacterium cerastii]|nr:helix-turn-helix transcriptional regulator [Methylobacterium cerastii]
MSGEKVLSSAQCRAARAMLGWSREDLAEKSGVSRPTLADFETDKRKPYDRTLADIQRTLETAGLEFIPENGGGAGIRFRERKAPAGE